MAVKPDRVPSELREVLSQIDQERARLLADAHAVSRLLEDPGWQALRALMVKHIEGLRDELETDLPERETLAKRTMIGALRYLVELPDSIQSRIADEDTLSRLRAVEEAP